MTTYDTETALVVVDVQNDFADPNGSLYVAGGERVVAAVNKAIYEAAAGGAFVVYTQDWHPAETPHFADYGGIWPLHCVMDGWGAALHPDLIVTGPIVKKGSNGEDGYSGFTMRDPVSGDEIATELRDLLTERNVARTVVVGLALDYCVKETALDSARLGFETVVIDRATAAVNLAPTDGDEARASLKAAGAGIEQ